MQTTFPTLEETAHVWASRSQEHGKNGTGSMFFRDRIIYSYGEHYPIAKILDPIPLFTFVDSTVVFFNDVQSSATTEGKHKNAVRNAIPSLWDVIYVTDVKYALETSSADIENQNYIKEKIQIAIKRHFNARKVSRLNEISYLVEQYKLYREYTSYPIDNTWFEQIDWVSIHKKHAELISETRKQELLEKRRLEKERQKFLNKFMGTKNVTYDTSLNYIKVLDKNIITDGGAKVPLDAAQTLKRIYKKNPEKLINKKVGHYTINSIIDGYIVIGCHTFGINHLLEMIPER